jgi:hypothetical protein
MVHGTASFERIVTTVCGHELPASWWSRPVIYIVDRDSILPVEDLWRRAQAVGNLVREASGPNQGLARFAPFGPQWLSGDEVRSLTGQDRSLCGWMTGERSIFPGRVADAVSAAVSRREIELVSARVGSIRRSGAVWRAECSDGSVYESRGVLNCSWESRWLLDRGLGVGSAEVSIRYKVALFGSAAEGWPKVHPSTRILGAFGDVTPYGEGSVYLSWYPVGLVAESENGIPPAIPQDINRHEVMSRTLTALGLSPPARIQWSVRGGFIVAAGRGRITDPHSSLHERHHPRARVAAPRYISVDTGKYALGPLLGERAAELLLSVWDDR